MFRGYWYWLRMVVCSGMSFGIVNAFVLLSTMNGLGDLDFEFLLFGFVYFFSAF